MNKYFFASPVALAVAQREDGQIQAGNAAFAGLIGVGTDGMQRHRLAEFFAPLAGGDDPAALLRGASPSDETAREVAVRVRTPGREQLEGVLLSNPLADGDADLCVVAYVDLTEHNRIRRAHQDARNYNQSLLESLPDIVFVLDAQGIFVDCSFGHRQQMLLPPEQVIGANAASILPPDVAAKLLDGVRATLHDQDVAPFEYSLPLPGGQAYFEARLTKLGVDHVMAVVRDVTEAHRVRQDLLLQTRLQELLMDLSATYIHLPTEQLDSAIANSLRDLSLFVEADRAYVFEYHWDGQYCRNTHEWCQEGIEPQIDLLQYTPLDQVPEAVECHQRGEPMYIPDVLALPEGSLREILEQQGILSLLLVPMMTPSGPVGFVGFDSVRKHHAYSQTEQRLLTVFGRMLVQVQDRRAADEALREATRRAEQLAEVARRANDAKSEFLAHMSHEIRTPMHGILGTTELLAATPLQPEQRSFVQTIGKSADGLMALLNDVLDFSKIEAGQLALESAPFDAVGLVQDVVRLFEPVVANRPVRLSFACDPALPRNLLGDAVRVRQIASNLVSNAVKFTESGLVEVTWGGDALPNGQWQFRLIVRDTGVGIADSQLSRLFLPFSQADSSNARRFGGTGLGLALVRKLAEAMGGSVDLRSVVGQGTRVEVTLPLTPDAAAVIDPHLSPGTTQRVTSLPAGSRVLVVEDQEVNRAIAVRVLEQAGAATATAVDGQQAVQIASMQSFDLILMDCQLPILDGLEATRQIRAAEQALGRRTPIVAVTAHATSTDRQRCLDAGMDDYLTKPTPRDTLLRVVKAWIQDGKRPSQTPAVSVEAARLEELLDMFGDEGLWQEILSPFVAESHAAVERLLQAATEPIDAEALRKQAHALSGSARAIGLVEVASKAKDLELKAKSGAMAELAPATTALCGALAAAAAALSDRRLAPVTTAAP